MNTLVNKFLFLADSFIPKMHLGQPELTKKQGKDANIKRNTRCQIYVSK